MQYPRNYDHQRPRHDQLEWDERFSSGNLDDYSEEPGGIEFHRGSPDGKDYLRDSRENHPGRRESFYAGQGPKNYQRSDERIQEEVCEALTRHPEVDADSIEVDVKDGEVTLSGTVPSRHMKHMAEDCTERCMGVKDIHNNIRVKKDHGPDINSDRTTFLF